MASDLRGYTEQETLNKVLNTDNDSIQVDIVDATGVTITTSNESVYADDADWTNTTSKHTLVGGLYQSTPQSITDGDTGPLQVNENGNLIVDLSATDNAVLDAMVVDLAALEVLSTAANVDHAAIEVLLTAANVDHAANEVLLTAIESSADSLISTNHTDLVALEATLTAIETDQAAIEVLLTAANVDHAANEVLLGTIDSDTDATKSALNKMLYGTGLVITALDGGGGDQTLGATYESLYVGVGGNVKVTLATSASDFTFVNVASGQMLPIQITHVKQSGTTATNMIAMKA